MDTHPARCAESVTIASHELNEKKYLMSQDEKNAEDATSSNR